MSESKMTALELADQAEKWGMPNSWHYGEIPSPVYCVAIAAMLREQAAEIERLRADALLLKLQALVKKWDGTRSAILDDLDVLIEEAKHGN